MVAGAAYRLAERQAAPERRAVGRARGVALAAVAAAVLALPAAALTLPAAAHEPAGAAVGPQVATVSPPAVLPRLPLPAEASAHLLDEADARRYALIFDLQERGDWAGADQAVAQLQDRRLMGHVLYQRYRPDSGYTASHAQLRDWLGSHADHPGAAELYALARQRQPRGAEPPRAPERPAEVEGQVHRFGMPMCPAAADLSAAAEAAKRTIRRYALRAQPDRALLYLQGPGGAGLGPVEYDRLLGEVAAAYFYAGDDAAAVRHAEAAAARSGGRTEVALWTAGLAEWRRGDVAAAARWFEQYADAECSNAWESAAGAYWAARAHLRDRNYAQVSGWLERAARQPRTFYGLLARRGLGLDVDYRFDAPPVTRADVEALAREPGGRRALALLQVGQPDLAEGELLRLRAAGHGVGRAAIALAQQADLPGTALQLALIHQPGAGSYYDGALWPVAAWQPEGGYRVDRALVQAIMREESRFNPRAISHAGATGLMQLMPQTASAVAGQNLRGTAGRQRLFDPAFNMLLGQRYVQQLLAGGGEGGLMRVLIGYNAGPGNAMRWLESTGHGGDPLLFLESIPLREPREYTRHVLTSLWIYRHRLGQAAPSLDRLAAGDWPRYTGLDRGAAQVAERARD